MPDQTHENGQPVSVGSTGGSARMTLMRGSPEEIDRDFAAIDAKIADLTRSAESWRTVAGELMRELRDMREFVVDRGYSDETSDGIQDADNALASYENLWREHMAKPSPNKKCSQPAT